MDQIIAEAKDAFKEAEREREDVPEDVLEEALEDFERAIENESEDRTEALDDIRFARLAEQWPDAIKRDRENSNRPCLTINRLPAYMRQIINDGRQNRPSIKVRPSDSGSDQQTAQILSGLIRNIEQNSGADIAYDTALEGAVGNGFGYWRVGIKYASDDAFDLDLEIQRISNPFTVYRDPTSKAADSSDWNVAFVTEMVDMDDFEKSYKGADPVDWRGDYDGLKAPWRDGDQVRLAEYWKRNTVRGELLKLSNGMMVTDDVFKKQAELMAALGIRVEGSRVTQRQEVIQHVLSGAEVLHTSRWPGRFIPIVPVYGDEVNVEGKRTFRSMVRDAKDPQRMFNYWRTTATELVALAPKAPWVGPKGFANSSKNKWETANTENHSYLEYDMTPGGAPPQRQAFAGVPAGALQEALNASDDMKAIMGMFDASLGARSNETSGVAIVARQREGDVSNFHFLDNQSRAIRHTGRILIDLIPHIYTGPRMVRVLGPDDSVQNVPVNQQVQMPNGAQGIFDITTGRYDVTVEAGPSFATRRQEAANQMVELMRAYPPAAPLLGDLLAKNLDWPGAEEIAARLKTMLPPQLQGQGDPRLAQAQQMIQALQQQIQQGAQGYEALKAELARVKGDLSIKAQEANIKGYSAETDRLQATAAAMSPQQVQALVMQTLRQVLGSPDVLPNSGVLPSQQPFN